MPAERYRNNCGRTSSNVRTTHYIVAVGNEYYDVWANDAFIQPDEVLAIAESCQYWRTRNRIHNGYGRQWEWVEPLNHIKVGRAVPNQCRGPILSGQSHLWSARCLLLWPGIRTIWKARATVSAITFLCYWHLLPICYNTTKQKCRRRSSRSLTSACIFRFQKGAIPQIQIIHHA